MKLKEFSIRNFRCYREQVSIKFDDLTTFVGLNDAGKSTILEALDIFLNEGAPDKNDLSKSALSSDIEFCAVFDDLPSEVILDDRVPTSFEKEFLLNQDGKLEIWKVFNGSLSTPKIKAWFSHSLHPVNPTLANLLKLGNSDLKSLLRDSGADSSSINLTINSEIRAALRDHCGDGGLAMAKISFLKDDAEKIGKAVQAYMPAFALFKSDRSSTDQDPEAQDPLRLAVKEAVKQKEQELNAIAEFVNGEVKKIADLTLAKLREMDGSLASSLNPQFTPPNWASLFKPSITGDEDIPINKRGSGVRRLILLNFFRAKVERDQVDNKKTSTIYAIEEPETSQHPRNQRLLVNALHEISSHDQVILTTHTPMLARVLPVSSLRFIRDSIDADVKEVLEGGSDQVNELIASSLGVLPDHNVRVFIGVEGKTDIPFLKNISKLLVSAGEDVLDLDKEELDGTVIFTPFGGSGLAEWTNRLSPINRPEYHIYDRDTQPPDSPKYKKYMDEVNLRANCVAVCTQKREIENYLHVDAINAALAVRPYGEVFNTVINDFSDVPKEFCAALNPNLPQGVQWGSTRSKEFLCASATKFMTIGMLNQVDPDGEIKAWMKKITEIFRTSPTL